MTASVDSQQTSGNQQAGDDVSPDPTPAAEPAPGPDPDPAPAGRPRPTQNWTHTLARQAATVSAKLTPIAQCAGDRVAAASPRTLLLGLLGVLTTLSIVVSLAFDDSLGVTSAVLFVPVLSAAIGAVGMRWADERRKHQVLQENARHDATQLRHLEHTLDYVDAKLTAALAQFGSDGHNDAVIAMFQAKAATELYRGSETTPHSALIAATTNADWASRYPLRDFDTPSELRQGDRLERAGLSLI